MTQLKNHPAFWLAPAAAASLERFERDHGVITINSAGRYEAEQQALINRWNAGGVLNRPPFLYKPAMPANTSRHVALGGIAIDTNDTLKMHQFGEHYGWFHTFDYDVPHFEYQEARDLASVETTAPASSKPAKPISNPTPAKEEDIMASLADLQSVVNAAVKPLEEKLETLIELPASQSGMIAQINGQYQDVLGRDGDAGGVQANLTMMTSGGWGIAEVRAGLIASDEYTYRWVANQYRDLLKREGSAAEIQGWVNWKKVNNKTLNDVLAQLQGSAEYKSKH